MESLARLSCVNLQRMYFAPLFTSGPPALRQFHPGCARSNGRTAVIRKVLLQRNFWQFGLEKIDFVEEENDTRAEEPSRVDHALEQDERLVHSILTCFLEEHLVVLRESDAEDDGGDRFEAVDPLFALGTLPANVEHAARRQRGTQRRQDGLDGKLPRLELGLADACRLGPRVQHIRLIWNESRLPNSRHLVEEAALVSFPSLPRIRGDEAKAKVRTRLQSP